MTVLSRWAAVVLAGALAGSVGPGVGAGEGSGFVALDRNQDGFLSVSEVSADEKLVARFRELDSDGDGRLSASEWMARKSPRKERDKDSAGR